MLRGSRPGERRGGRRRLTPNRRTILTDRILAIGLDHPAVSRREFLLKLAKDQKLPADTRIAVAPKCFPPKRTRSSRTGRPRALAGSRSTAAHKDFAEVGSAGTALVPAMQDWNPEALDALFGIVQDATADPKAQRQAALKIAQFLLPKVPKRAKLLPDEYGFSISASLATAYRDNELELRALVNDRTRNIPAIAEKIKKLEARSNAIRRRLQVPCPTKYNNEAAVKDGVRLLQFRRLRDDNVELNEAQQAEEAHVKARVDVFAVSPESIARNRRQALQDAELRFERNRSTGASFAAPPTRKDRNDLKLLRRLYPKFHPDENLEERSKSDRKVSEPDFDDSQFAAFYDELSWYQPFRNESPAPDGNFYPPDSKLRPPAEDLLVKVADGAAMSPVSPTAATDPIQAVEPETIGRRLQVPCPTKYGTKEAAKDLDRLMQFGQLRDNNAALTKAQRAEEVRAKARFDAFAASPESIGRRRRKALEDAERQFKLGQLTKEFHAPPLSRKDQNDLERLRWLYPKFHPKENLEERSKSDVPEPDFDHFRVCNIPRRTVPLSSLPGGTRGIVGAGRQFLSAALQTAASRCS